MRISDWSSDVCSSDLQDRPSPWPRPRNDRTDRRWLSAVADPGSGARSPRKIRRSRRSRRTVVGAPAYSRTRPLAWPMLKPPNSRKSGHRGEQSLQNTRPWLRPFSGYNRGRNGQGRARGSHLIVNRNKLRVNYAHTPSVDNGSLSTPNTIKRKNVV